MTIISLKTENFRADKVVKAEFSDGSSFIFTTDYLPEGRVPEGKISGDKPESVLFEPGRELSSGEEETFRFAAACYRAERIALRLIARAEQNSLALTAKLERRGFDAAVAKTVVSRLFDRNLLNDGRYAESWIRSRLALRKAPSPQWLLAALGKRGIKREFSLKALKKTLDPETEYALLLRYLEKIRFSKSGKAFSLKAELKYQGFSSTSLERYFED